MLYRYADDQPTTVVQVTISVNGGEACMYWYKIPSAGHDERLLHEIASSLVRACTCSDDEYRVELRADGTLMFARERKRVLVTKTTRSA